MIYRRRRRRRILVVLYVRRMQRVLVAVLALAAERAQRHRHVGHFVTDTSLSVQSFHSYDRWLFFLDFLQFHFVRISGFLMQFQQLCSPGKFGSISL